jgi:beta-glucosidase/6-phospho-beta-glucosidase/beta-galactosidase
MCFRPFPHLVAAAGTEWREGWSKRFGLVHIDLKDNLKRTPKKSAHWYSQHFLKASQ